MLDTVHVAAAIITDGTRIFAAQRGYGPMKDGWEFPGGKVEEGETAEQACRREVREELGVELWTTWYLDTVRYEYPDFRLVMDVFVARLAAGQEPSLLEHESARWLTRDDLLTVDWLPADRELVRSLGMAWDEIFGDGEL